MQITDIKNMLRELGYNNARNALKNLAARSAIDERLARASAPDVIDKGRLPAWAEYSPESVSLMAGADASIAAVRLNGLAVIAGRYDDSVRAGLATYTVDGALPPLTAAAHEHRMAAL